MTLPPERVADRGQRYEVQVEGYPNDGWTTIGWSNDEEGSRKMGSALATAPGAQGFRVRDRQAEAWVWAGRFPAGCQHDDFRCDAAIGRLSQAEGGPITGYTADIKVTCAQCGLPFRFVGLAAGNHYAEPRVSIDGTELRAPIEPATHERFAPAASYSMPPRQRQ